MAPTRCPACPSHAPPVFLAVTSSDAFVNYHRCPDCGHVWSTTKDDGAFLKHVTPLREPSSPDAQ